MWQTPGLPREGSSIPRDLWCLPIWQLANLHKGNALGAQFATLCSPGECQSPCSFSWWFAWSFSTAEKVFSTSLGTACSSAVWPWPFLKSVSSCLKDVQALLLMKVDLGLPLQSSLPLYHLTYAIMKNASGICWNFSRTLLHPPESFAYDPFPPALKDALKIEIPGVEIKA